MKNKKLFAILTLVCFMFTLMPVAAFAGDGDVIKIINSNDKKVSSITITEGEAVNFAYNPEGDANENEGKGLFIVKDGKLATTESALTGVEFDKAGTYEVYAADADEIADVMTEKELKEVKLALLKELETATENYVTVKVKPNTDVIYTIELDVNDEYDVDAPAAVEDEFFKDGETPSEYDITINANDGWDNDGHYVATLYKYTVVETEEDDEIVVTYENKTAVEDVELTFTEVGYADVVLADGNETDYDGSVAFEVVADRTGDYKVLVKYGNKATLTLNVEAQAQTAANVSLVAAPTAPVDVDADVQFVDIEFKFVDANGNAYTMGTEEDDVTVAEGSAVKVDVTSKPADSNVDTDTFKLVKEADDADGVYTLVGEFDEEGEYTIKVTLKNGKSAEVTVKAAEQGEIVGIKFDVYNTPRTVAYGAQTVVDAVLAYDAAGVVSAPDGVEFSANGVAIDKFNMYVLPIPGNTTATEFDGGLIVLNDDDYIGSTITVLAEYEGFTATTVLTVVDKPNGITFADATAEVGVNTEITGTVVDGDGKMSSIAKQDWKAPTIVLEKPANAVAVADAKVTDKGAVILNFLASEAGTYKVHVSVTYGDNSNFVSGVATINVGGAAGQFKDVVVVSIGADSMIVNSEVVKLDVAPYITNGRTMLQYNVLGAFGFDVQWVGETQSVVAEGNGIKVVMTIGSKVAVVNGAEVALDVAPQIVNGRTIVPVGFLTGNFGITPNFTYNADGTIADIIFTAAK